MENGITLLPALTLLGAAHGIFLSLALLNAKAGDISSHRILSLFTFLFAIDLGEEFLYQTGFFSSAPHLLQVLSPIDLKYGPVLYFYVSHLTSRGNTSNQINNSHHFVPVIAGALLLTPFYFFLTGTQKLQFVESLRTGEITNAGAPISVVLGVSLFALLTLLQIGFYLVICIREVRSHNNNITQEFSDLEKINLAWLRNLLVGLSLIYLLFVGDQFFPDFLGMNFLGDSITILAVILIYTMGYLGLRQPKIFTHSLRHIEQSTGNHATQNDSEFDLSSPNRYKKSGLDKETSQSFLDELLTHMVVQKPYLQGGLTLPELASQLGITPNYLSQIINEQKNLNFHDFINQYRVEEAKRLIQTTEKPNILQIAFDAGFNSKSAFYTAFKKATSMTPTQFAKTADQ